MAENARPQPPPASAPDPALRRLDRLVGTWDIQGRTPGSQLANITGWSTFEWLPGRFFLEVRGGMTVGDFKVQSLELIGYESASQTFTSKVYSNLNGLIMSYHWDVQGNVVTHWDDTAIYTGTLSADGQTLRGGWRPREGQAGPDNLSYDVVMTRVSRGAKASLLASTAG